MVSVALPFVLVFGFVLGVYLGVCSSLHTPTTRLNGTPKRGARFGELRINLLLSPLPVEFSGFNDLGALANT